jgi:Protein of unknown function (DUF1538).
MSLLLDFIDLRGTARDVLLGLAPLAAIGLIFGLRAKLPRERLLALARGAVLVFAGLVLFLQGVKTGFLPTGELLGKALGTPERAVWLAPVGFALGLAVTVAEPAVRILGDQVERATRGSIRRKVIIAALCLGVALAVGLGMGRMLLGLPIHFHHRPGLSAGPGHAAILRPGLSRPSPSTPAPVATGTSHGQLHLGRGPRRRPRPWDHTEPLLDGFGLVAVVALDPVLCVMAAGVVHTLKTRRTS